MVLMFGVGSTLVSFVVHVGAAQETDAQLIARVSAYVEQHYTRAQTLLVTETTVVEPVTPDLEVAGPPRRIVNEMRIEWSGAIGTEPREVRELQGASGSRFGPSGQPDCLDQRSITFAPLGFLLPVNREKFRFSVRSFETINGVRTLVLPFTGVGSLERGVIRDPGELNVDLAIARRFPIAGRAGVTIRAEAFNVINRVNFNGPAGNNNLTVTTNAAGQAIFNSPNFG